MPRNTYSNIMFTNKVNTASFGIGKEKYVALIKRKKLTQEFEERLEVTFHKKVGSSGSETLELIFGLILFLLNSKLKF